MKKILIIPTVLISLIIFAVVSAFWWRENIQPVSNQNQLQEFLIKKGQSATSIGEDLKKEGLIKSPLAFKIYVQVTGKQSKIFAGEYRLSPNYSLTKIVDQLTKGPVELWVTIPEGLRREEIGQKFIEGLEPPDPEVFFKDFLTASEGKEGLLFPDTYLFPKDASASAVVKRMLSVFDIRVDENLKKDINTSGYSLNEVVTIASIVEREAITDEERPIVAGILYKRLEAGWPLQADAAVQYALATDRCGNNINCDWWPRPITSDDLQISSPYNTYKFNTLPPAPIANPGLSSIKAAIYPEDSEYWYYLHDSKGVIHYAQTLEEHNENIRIYLGK